MQNGRIAHFEDDRAIAGAVSMGVERFSNGRYTVVANAYTLEESLDTLGKISRGELVANVILSDGNLSGTGGADARTIMERVSELGLDVRTVLMSGQSPEEIGVTVDAVMPKVPYSAHKLVEVIDGLAEIAVEAS